MQIETYRKEERKVNSTYQPRKNLIIVIDVFYALILLYLLFFKRVGLTHSETYAEFISISYNFIPFKSVYVFLTTPVMSMRVILDFMVNFVGNIVLFIPWGILQPISFKKMQSFKCFIILTLIALVLVETIQLFTMLGSFDIEDVLLNMLGACTGFALYNLCNKLARRS